MDWVRAVLERYHYWRALRGKSRHKSLAEQEIEAAAMDARIAKINLGLGAGTDNIDDDIDWEEED